MTEKLTARPPRWFWAVVCVQLLIPAVVLLVNPVPSRFGFHMYARGEQMQITARDESGRELTLPDHLVSRPRLDLPWLDHLPEAVCDRIPEAHEVTVKQASRARTVTCTS